MNQIKTDKKRVDFHMPYEEYEKLQCLAKRRGTTGTNQLRRYLGLGFAFEEVVLKGEEDIVLRNKKIAGSTSSFSNATYSSHDWRCSS